MAHYIAPNGKIRTEAEWKSRAMYSTRGYFDRRVEDPKPLVIDEIADSGSFRGEEDGRAFGASFDRYIISKAWHAGVDFEDLADGFGKGLGTMGGDWSGIRDSSGEAIRAMLARALQHMTFSAS